MQFLKTPKKWLKINKKSQTCNDKKNRIGEENKGPQQVFEAKKQ
jgi:hypothetical protein